MPTELVESELFGYRKGAFTGAYIDRPGKFEFANEGTIFLDEIAEFTPSVQAKLLQVLQDGQFSRLGSNEEVQVNVRVVAATNRHLETAIREGRFREDLYYRLNVVNINISPLRHRPEDIPAFCEYFLKNFSQQYGLEAPQIPDSLMETFLAYDWPGNVRELENLVKRYVVLQEPLAIEQELKHRMAAGRRTGGAPGDLTDAFEYGLEQVPGRPGVRRQLQDVAQQNRAVPNPPGRSDVTMTC
jgi:two-component system response regulator AtoC